jgi:hypothetical protein
MRIILCWFNLHRWTVSKATGLDRRACAICGREEFRHGTT